MDERCENCRPSIELESLKKENETTEKRLNDHAERLKKLENEAVGVAKDVGSFKESMIRIEKAIEKIAAIVENLKAKPGQRWEELTKTVIAVIATAAVTYFISRR